MKNKIKKDSKRMLINWVVGLLTVLIGSLAFRYFKTPSENWFFVIVFLLILIYLEILDKK